MRIGPGLISVLVRAALLWFVVASLMPVARRDRVEAAGSHRTSLEGPGSASHVSFSRAGVGFVASVAVTIMLMMALAPGSSRIPEGSAIGLRGSI
jgi:hypothetical protein